MNMIDPIPLPNGKEKSESSRNSSVMKNTQDGSKITLESHSPKWNHLTFIVLMMYY
jgi:hypothetical protein